MSEHFLHVGKRLVWGGEQPFGLCAADRARHLLLVGQTGTGKSTLMRNLVAQDIQAGQGVALIDPHGDLADEVMNTVPTTRIDDVVVIDPTDTQHVPAFNLFYRVPKDERALVASNITATFKHVWSDSWGPRLEHILRNTVRLVLDAPDAMRPCFLSIPRVLVESGYRAALLRHCEHERTRSFFLNEFEAWPARQRAEAISPVQNKVEAFLSNPFILNIVSQWKTTVDLDRILDRQQILIVRLPKGLIGEEQANLLGSFVVSGIMQAAMRKAPLQRKDFHMCIDEFQNFTTDSFSSILSEARKFRLSLTIGHQFTDQVPLTTRAAVFGNVGNMVSFRVGATDAERLSHEFGDISAQVFRDLERGEVIARMMEGGEVRQAFRGQTTPDTSYAGTAERVKSQSRYAYTVPREKVERRLIQWLIK